MGKNVVKCILKNAPFPMPRRVGRRESWTLDRLVQPLNALSQIETKHGRSMRTTSAKAMHPLKALAPIVCSDAIPDALMALSAAQLLKALSPIDSRLGRLETPTDVSELHPLKAPAPIV